MVSDKSMHHHPSIDPNDLDRENMESNSKVGLDANESQVDSDDVSDAMFVIEDLGKQKEENQVSCTMDNGGSFKLSTQSVELVESVSISHLETGEIVQSDNSGENGTIIQHGELLVDEMDDVNRPKTPCSNKESSVRVLYNSLPSCSKRKLEELLLQWSEWHAKNCSSTEERSDSLETGEENYFPALHVGSDKLSTVSYSMDVHVRKRQRNEAVSMEQGGSSLYDRGFAIGLSSDDGATGDRASCDWREAPRCFNCRSYSHALSECSKPRNNAAVNSARKQFLSKKSQNVGPRVPTRYYQESPGGKYDGLKPGVLSAETKQLLGVGEFDPPPWLNRMRELGYPPGYLDREEDQPSGITIFGDEETHNAATGNCFTSGAPKPPQKMTVDFPGINAPIPENADQWRWAKPAFRAPPSSDSHWNHSHSRGRHNNTQDSINDDHFRDDYRPWNHYQGPPHHYGLGSSPTVSRYPYNYHPSEPFSPRGIPIPDNPNYGRSLESGRPLLRYDYGSF